MPSLNNLKEAEAALQPFIPSVAEITGRDITLERMWPMMEIFGHPEQKLKIVHLAGTSGKSSTAYYIAGLLQAAGKKVGLHVSPHIDKITERIQINGQPITDELFCAELSEFLDIIYEHHIHPTYFELLIAFAYWFFARQAVDYAVIETGMGGLHDGTNVAKNPNKICVITDIGIDHTRFLGSTLPQITFQKAGIIHPNNQVYMYEQSPEIMEVVRTKCKSARACLKTTSENVERRNAAGLLNLNLPAYQQRNWLLAHFVFSNIQKQDDLPVLGDELITQTQNLVVPARMEIRNLGNKILVMDGAHNQQKMEAFVGSFQAKFPGKKAAILLGLKTGKDYKIVVDALLPIAAEIITSTFQASQDLPVVSMDPVVLAKYCRQQAVKKVLVLHNYNEAFEELLHSSESILVITGSFYLLNQIRSEEHLA